VEKHWKKGEGRGWSSFAIGRDSWHLPREGEEGIPGRGADREPDEKRKEKNTRPFRREGA